MFRTTYLITLSFIVIVRGNPAKSEGAQETHQATCQVTTNDIEATAKSTITRELKGVCSTEDLNIKFEALKGEIEAVKAILLALFPPADFSEKHNSFTTVQVLLREEINELNDTVIESSDGDLYFYYWQLLDIDTLLKKTDVYVLSPNFSAFGHTLNLQFYPNYSTNYIGISLKTGSDSFVKRHKISILTQTSERIEVSSNILYNINSIERTFKIDKNTLKDSFIHNNSLLIKLKIYLNS